MVMVRHLFFLVIVTKQHDVRSRRSFTTFVAADERDGDGDDDDLDDEDEEEENEEEEE